MATSKTDLDVTGSFTRTYAVTATADADTTLAITHGLSGVASDGSNSIVTLTPLLPVAYTAQWTVTGITATTLTLTKGTASTSSSGSAQLRVTLRVPHSIDH